LRSTVGLGLGLGRDLLGGAADDPAVAYNSLD
jgi:hypothetical protein